MAADAGSIHAGLKTKQRTIRDGFPPDLGLRVHRAISWIGRAEAATADDLDAAFVFYWIAFNAAYADDRAKALRPTERGVFDDYFTRLVRLDRGRRIYDAIWGRFSGTIRSLLNNRYVFQPFWAFHNRVPHSENWETAFESSRRRTGKALAEQDTRIVLTTLFDRLYVLRNQIVHGGATWNSAVNRNQLRDGVDILACLLPVFVDLMMDNPQEDWGAPHYPVIEEP